MAPSDYFADPCPSPSLTQSIVKVLIDRSPWHAWTQHPRLNPRFERDEATKFDLGNAAHFHLIGRGKDLVVIEATDWRTKDAKAAREKAISERKCAVLREQFDLAGDMAEAALNQLAAMGLADDWHPDQGDGEAVIAWREGDVWLRSMIDWLPSHRATVWDYKTTRASAAPHAVAARMADDGWCIQAAMHERGLDALDPANTGRRKHRFLVQECEPPYAINVVEIPEGAMTIGRKQLEFALNLWRECVVADKWPGYPAEIVRPDLPPWHETRWLEREIAEEQRRERIPSDILMAG
jgi:hypothetical protein